MHKRGPPNIRTSRDCRVRSLYLALKFLSRAFSTADLSLSPSSSGRNPVRPFEILGFQSPFYFSSTGSRVFLGFWRYSGSLTRRSEILGQETSSICSCKDVLEDGGTLGGFSRELKLAKLSFPFFYYYFFTLS